MRMCICHLHVYVGAPAHQDGTYHILSRYACPLTGTKVSNCESEGAPVSAFSSTVYSTAGMVPEGGGGGLAALNGAHLDVVDTTFTDNKAGNLGSSVLVHGTGSTAVLRRVAMSKNWVGKPRLCALELISNLDSIWRDPNLHPT